MKLIHSFILILLVLGSLTTNFPSLVGQETSFDRKLDNRDDQPLRELVESKENIDIKEKASNLAISGDVRFEWRTIREKGGRRMEKFINFVR